jgi:protein SCO1/2
MLAACSGDSSAPAPGPSIGQQLDAKAPVPVLQAPLVSSSGHWFNLGSLGKIVVLSDMMTLCQESCPLDTANVVAAARTVEKAGLGNRIQFVSLTIDPGRDTRAQLAAYRALYQPAPADWTVASAPPAVLHRIWTTLGVYIKKTKDKPPLPKNWRTGASLTYDLTHSDEVFFLDPAGHERFVLEGIPHVANGAPVPPVIGRYMDATGHQNLAHPDPQAWTLPDEMQVLSWLTGKQLPAPSSSG